MNVNSIVTQNIFTRQFHREFLSKTIYKIRQYKSFIQMMYNTEGCTAKCRLCEYYLV